MERVTGVSVLWTVTKECVGGACAARHDSRNDCSVEDNGAGDENRTRTACLEGRSSTIELHPRVSLPDRTTLHGNRMAEKPCARLLSVSARLARVPETHIDLGA